MRSDNLRPIGLRGRALLAEENIAVGAAPFEIEEDPPAKPLSMAEHRLNLAKQLICFATSLSDIQVSKAAGVPLDTVKSLRGSLHGSP